MFKDVQDVSMLLFVRGLSCNDLNVLLPRRRVPPNNKQHVISSTAMMLSFHPNGPTDSSNNSTLSLHNGLQHPEILVLITSYNRTSLPGPLNPHQSYNLKTNDKSVLVKHCTY